jgi:hypothetical protein
VLLLICGCDTRPPTTQSAGPAQPAPPTLTLLAPESSTWTQAQAAEHLSDEDLGLSAATRLVQLADIVPACLPDDLTDALIEQLALVRLTETLWALGIAAPFKQNRLHAAVLISADGTVTQIAAGPEEELLVLHVAEDPDVFPHVLTLPQRVLLVTDALSTALVLKPDQRVFFALRKHQGYPYVALVALGAGADDEAARYVWDPDEDVFLGPEVDKLPASLGGKFTIDLEASEALIPMGGEIPEPEPMKQRPPGPRPSRPRDRELFAT